jgi:secondary thiamine-phosphate synthase enzyme
MSRRSSVTTREQPVADATSVTGALKVHTETLTIKTDERLHVIDLTEQVMTIVRGLRVKEGVVNLFSMHTTCTIFINEFQTALLSDIKTFLETAVKRDADWRHNDPAHSDCDRMNADSHLRAMLLGHSLTVQVSGGEVVLGQWQRLLLVELDGPRTRTLRLSFMGIS